MNLSKKYTLLILVLILLFGMLIALNKVGEPLEEYLNLPRCEDTDIVITEDFRLGLISYANNHLIESVGEEYFEKHYNYLKLERDLDECVFEINYIYRYGQFHTPASIEIKALSEDSFDILEVDAFLVPIEVNIFSSRAESIAKENNIDYDYFNLEADFESQTLKYVFYEETIVEGNVPVFEIDAQSGVTRRIRETSPTITIV